WRWGCGRGRRVCSCQLVPRGGRLARRATHGSRISWGGWMSLSDLRVMVVEDHGFQRRMALRLLAEAGVGASFEAADGASALEVLRQLPQPPDVLLVDLDMPGMDGV